MTLDTGRFSPRRLNPVTPDLTPPRHGQEGFTLVELIIGMLILSIIIGSIASALIVTLGTTDATNRRMAENHDVQVTSAYLANDVQSAASVSVDPGSGNCSGAFTTLVTFTYSSAGSPQAVYECGTASNGETQVTRTFESGSPLVLAHFAGAARPSVDVTYDPAQPTVPVSVTMTFTKANDCALDCIYTLFGSRRSYNSATAGGSGASTGDVTLLSTGTSSPLWVQGSCPDPGTTLGCIVDPAKTALPISDVQNPGGAWTPTPMWSRLNDGDITTAVVSNPGSKAEARVRLSSVEPPDGGVNPTVEFSAHSASTGAQKVKLTLYNGSTALVSNNVNGVNAQGNYDWTLSGSDTARIPAAAYANLTLGFQLPNANGTDTLSVDGVAFDTLDVSAAGLLTVNGPLYVNSQLSSAVRLTGTKTATKIAILNGGDFQIWNPGACSGCNHSTVNCPACAWTGQQPWTNYPNSIPDPLRSLPIPPTGPDRTCTSGGTCLPGHYTSTLSLSSNTQLASGVYYLEQGISVTGSARITCAAPCSGVMLYIAGGSASFAGGSSVQLPAQTTGTYKGIVMFQARNDPNEVKFTGNAGSSNPNQLGGIVYVPYSRQVTLATGTAALSARSIIALNIKVSSSVTIG